jgi:hypothetical protein
VSAAEWLGVHGLVIRARDPRAVAARLRRILGWSTLASTKSEIRVGIGPEMFLAIRRDPGAGDRITLENLQVAVRGISGLRRKAHDDALGGDSWTRSAGEGLSITVREFRRPPRVRWRRPARRAR